MVFVSNLAPVSLNHKVPLVVLVQNERDLVGYSTGHAEIRRPVASIRWGGVIFCFWYVQGSRRWLVEDVVF
jgi:hypothetical protein